MFTRSKTALSIFSTALLAAVPAYAADQAAKDQSAKGQAVERNNADTPNTGNITTQEIERAWDQTKQAANDISKDVSHSFKKAYKSLSNEITGNPITSAEEAQIISFDIRSTSASLIGHDVVDEKGQKIATIDDVVLSRTGQAEKLILQDGGLFGLGGKHVALDYTSMVHQADDARLYLGSVSKDVMKKVTPFNKQTDLTASQLYATDLQDIALRNPAGQTVGHLENTVLMDDDIKYMVISFDQILGMGGHKALMSASLSQVVSDSTGPYMQLTQAQSNALQLYKRAIDLKEGS